jgi:hypothetical protein
VFHITDLPSILSGKQVLFLDPHVNFLPEPASHLNPGLMIG